MGVRSDAKHQQCRRDPPLEVNMVGSAIDDISRQVSRLAKGEVLFRLLSSGPSSGPIASVVFAVASNTRSRYAVMGTPDRISALKSVLEQDADPQWQPYPRYFGNMEANTRAQEDSQRAQVPE
ncbi:uncharacterized protein FIBRA_02722 [Fibroporia radiculosa]|uniref:Uncharacterized protein n=1 Tax=Fibroporia radiculosa TaxID=599839 RepID=J4G2H0_9APHY|nr:uncharacterized protein FIBRA_02722 [Fibroporia radiculosa]CCM00683.1 predicted protein [Fibroporia radiculosa]